MENTYRNREVCILFPKKGENDKNAQNKINIRLILHIVCIVGFVCCAAWLIWYFVSLGLNRSQTDELREKYVAVPPVQEPAAVTTAPAATPEPTPEPNLFGGREYPDLTGLDVPSLNPDFAGLQEINPDVYAWLYVPDTSIDYPVVQRPGDANYYLRRDINGNDSTAGTLFTQYYNHTDWTDNLTVIYGHNMRDGSMFATLHNFEDSVFFEEHPYIYIYTPEYTLVYQVFAAYNYPDQHLLLSYTMNDHDSFALYLDQVMSQDGLGININRDVEVTADDHVLTLSTCVSRNMGEYRYLVQAKLYAAGKNISTTESAENERPTGTTGNDSE